MGLISCANFVIAGVDGVIHQRDFTSVKINVNITLITVLVDVTYNTNQSWFVANILENKYNLLFYWHFSRWEIICIHGTSNSLQEYNLLGELVETVLVQWEWLRGKWHECEKNNCSHWYGNYWFCFGNTNFQDTFRKVRELHFYQV